MAISESVRRIVYHTFDEDDPDKDFELTLGEGITGIAWETKRFAFGVLPGQGLADMEKAGTVRADGRSAFCVPLFRLDVPGRKDLLERPPFGVLVLDSIATIDPLKSPADPTGVITLVTPW